jgi:putative PIG3 family NAD(P)H quinone oxidoreductase
MRYVTLTAFGASDVLQLAQMPIPQPKPNEVLIKVHAAGINRPDILQRQGLYPAPENASPLLGLEVAGEVVACGADVQQWCVGDKVCALVDGSGYADYALAPAAQCLPIPTGYSYLQAAALPETFFTVWHNLFQRAALQAGETLLIHGGASGIGVAAIQIAQALGVRVIATAGSIAKCAAIEALGAVAIHHREIDFVAEVKRLTQGQGVNVILDMVGGDYIQRNFSAAAKEGRIVNIAFLNGSRTTVDFMPLMLKRLTLTGSTLRAQSAAIKADIAAELKATVWPLLEAKKISPLIDSVFQLADVALAHDYMESNQHIGKIILDVAPIND